VIVLPSLVAERIESVKAGMLASVVFATSDGVTILINHFLGKLTIDLQFWQIASLFDLGLQLAIAFVSGFLFGVTYRYIIRGDRNSHLQDGAVLAFGLVRGFALIEGTSFTPLWLLPIVESILSFAIARLSLDWALQLKLIKPFL
jgi:hypothetical protein